MKATKKTMVKGAVGYGLLTILAFAIIISVLPQPSSAALTFTGRDCNGNQICDVVTDCSVNGQCTNSFENCQSCGVTTKVCPTGVVTADNTCDKSSGTPSCAKGTPTCTATSLPGITDPYVILLFNIFTKKNLIIAVTPDTQTGLAGSTLNFKATVENKNPKTLIFKITSEIPDKWQINIPAEISLGTGEKKEIAFRVTSNETAADAVYPITIAMFNPELSLFGSASATYMVASRGPPSISTNPESQEGYPGEILMYNVSVTNNDPKDFDASTITLRASVPSGWNAVFAQNSIKVAPRATGYVRLDVTSPANATGSNQLTLNATVNRLSASETIEYKINLCGNGICEIGEESCTKDCPFDPNINCNGRCERELDDGLAFSASVNVAFNNFVICNRNSTTEACVKAANATCGIGRQCICTSAQPNCKALCVDTKGVYYLAAASDTNTRSIANYSFACPYVNLPEIKLLRDNFTAAQNSYEKAQSSLREFVKTNISVDKLSESRPCIDALSSMISSSGDFVNYLNAVIAWPGKINTTAARSRAPVVRSAIDSLFNSFCRGAKGLLRIDSISVEPVEKDNIGNIDVTVKNVGNIRYYGYVQCDFTGSRGEKSSDNSSCIPVTQQLQTSILNFNATSPGKWSALCGVYGSLESDCLNASLHHQADAQFNVSTRDAFIVSISGACGQQINCSVKGSQDGCSSCSASGQACTLISSNGTDLFSCPRSTYGNYTLVGSIITNDRCKPVPPEQKSAVVRCPGCGDGQLDPGEQCEPPSSNNNNKCPQASSTCEGKLYGTRDAFGFCSARCGCSADEYQFSCSRGKCGASCIDGETRTVVLNSSAGQCSCVQQCGSGCDWDSCGCEPTAATTTTTTTTSTTGVPFVNVTNTQPASGQVTLTATGGNLTQIEIFVDGFLVKTCSASPCFVTATYAAGTHTYFARATNALDSATDPVSGTKSFTVPETSTTNRTTTPASNGTTPTNQTNQSAAVNQTTVTRNNISLTTSHSPQNPTTADTVTITAVASSNANRIEMYIDGVISKICTDFLCTFASTYPAGTHTYFALAFDPNGNSVANPATGTKSFIVSRIATNGTTQTNGTNNNTSTGTTSTGNSLNITTLLLDASASPSDATTQDSVTISAIAHGPRSFREINIFIDDLLKKTCTNYAPSQQCTFRSSYPAGTHTYFATAIDVTNNSIRDPTSDSKSFSVSSPGQTGTTTTTTTTTTASTTGAAQQGRCYAKIDAKNCTYNPSTRRYDLFLAGSWDNGTHAHWNIEDNNGPKIYVKNFTHTEPLAGPGLKTVKVEVHNVNDSNLCLVSEDIYCGPGTSTGKDIDIIYDVKDVVKLGVSNVRVIVVSYSNINGLRLMSYVDNKLGVSNVRVTGNTSLAGISGPTLISDDRKYTAYTVTTSLAAGQNITINYKINISSPGEYKLSAIANYSGLVRVDKTIKATDCPQSYSVLAAGPGNACKSFTTPCEAQLAGWTVVDKCPEATPVPQKDNTLVIAIILIIIGAAAFVAYRYRDGIKERLGGIRRKQPEEEMPRFE